MNKRVTIGDVAEAAGVCKATVSYVLNDRKDQKISEATKKKVWQVVNMLGYRPNAFAQNMRTAEARQMIGVCLPEDMSALEKAASMDFLSDLSAVLKEQNASIVLLGCAPERINTADALIACSLTREQFFALGECNFIPLLAVNCRIDDSLFFEVAPDYFALKLRADAHFGSGCRYVCIPPRDEALRREIKGVFPDALFVRTFGDLEKVTDRNLFVTQRALAEAFSARACNVYFPDDLGKTSAETVAACTRLALSHEPYEQHIFKVS